MQKMEPHRGQPFAWLGGPLPGRVKRSIHLSHQRTNGRQVKGNQNRRSLVLCFVRRKIDANSLALPGRLGGRRLRVVSRLLMTVMAANQWKCLGRVAGRRRSMWMMPAASQQGMDEERGDGSARNYDVHIVLSHRYDHRPPSQASLRKTGKNHQSRPSFGCRSAAPKLVQFAEPDRARSPAHPVLCTLYSVLHHRLSANRPSRAMCAYWWHIDRGEPVTAPASHPPESPTRNPSANTPSTRRNKRQPAKLLHTQPPCNSSFPPRPSVQKTPTLPVSPSPTLLVSSSPAAT